jgi:hypothetical protein
MDILHTSEYAISKPKKKKEKKKKEKKKKEGSEILLKFLASAVQPLS